MRKKDKIFILVIIATIFSLVLIGCREADRVSYNLSKEADSFNVARKVTVINLRTDTILFEIVGNFSLNLGSDGDLEIIGENEDETFYKHFVHIPDREVTYISEDLGSTGVNKYKYSIKFNPNMIMPVEIITEE